MTRSEVGGKERSEVGGKERSEVVTIRKGC